MIDLHCHSYYSDGVLSPNELLQLASKQGLQYLSLTDHDTLSGYSELNAAAIGCNIKIIQGIELSCRWKKHDIHILGYQVQLTSGFANLIARQNTNRIQRAQEIGTLLHPLGVEDAYQKACDLAGHQRIGRPHFARVLMEEGLAKEMQEAFKKFLGRGKPAYVPTQWLSLQEAVEGIKEAGGQAVIAHPLKYGLTRSKLHELIRDFKVFGGEGMEVVSGAITPAQVTEMAGTCSRFELLASSGSDFHGPTLSRVTLGGQQQLPIHCEPIWQQWTL